MACHTGEHRSCSLLNSSNAFPLWKSKIQTQLVGGIVWRTEGVDVTRWSPRGSRSWKFHAEYFQTLWQKSTSFVYRSLHFSRAFCIWYRYNVGIGSSLSKTKQKKHTREKMCDVCAIVTCTCGCKMGWDFFFTVDNPKIWRKHPGKLAPWNPKNAATWKMIFLSVGCFFLGSSPSPILSSSSDELTKPVWPRLIG